MSFQLFRQLSSEIDKITETYVTDISSRVITEMTPIVSIGLSIAFIIYGFLIVRGVIDMPVSDFLNRCIRISIIASIALIGGLYQTKISGLITELPNDLASSLIAESHEKNTIAALIDKTAEQGFNRAGEAFEECILLNTNGLLYGLFGTVVLLTTSALVAVGGTFILLTKIALALLAGLGPLFIAALLWQSTYRFFEQWVSQVMHYVFFIVLFAAVSSVLMSIFSNYMADLKFDGSQNISYALGGATILSIIFVMLLLKISTIASALAKGVTFKHMWRQGTTRSSGKL